MSLLFFWKRGHWMDITTIDEFLFKYLTLLLWCEEVTLPVKNISLKQSWKVTLQHFDWPVINCSGQNGCNCLWKKAVPFIVLYHRYFSVFFLNFYRSDYIIEKEPLVNRFISVPSDGGKVTNIIDWSVWQQFDWFQMGKLHIGQKYTPLCVCSVFTKQCTLHYWFVFDIP